MILGRNYGVIKGEISRIEMKKSKKGKNFLVMSVNTQKFGIADISMFESPMNDIYSIARLYKKGDKISVVGSYSINKYASQSGKTVSTINFVGRKINKIEENTELISFSFDGVVKRIIEIDDDFNRMLLSVDNSYVDRNGNLIKREEEVYSFDIDKEVKNVIDIREIEEGDFVSLCGDKYNIREFDEKWGKYTNNYIQKMLITDIYVIKKKDELEELLEEEKLKEQEKLKETKEVEEVDVTVEDSVEKAINIKEEAETDVFISSNEDIPF